ncbi:MAG: GNAT family N-acetyltransferase [Clostridia bacterium]|nr:GNAT family N-acetyltransferase [Clostridia bacterium]
MILTHENMYQGVSPENTFVARTDKNKLLGVCTVSKRNMEMLFPDCPTQYVIRTEGDSSSLAALYGAAVARIRMLHFRKATPARAYAEVNVDDEESLNVLEALGFQMTDGVVRMYRNVTGEDNYHLLPPGCTIVRDFLGDPMERRFFLERYNACYDLHNDEAWLDEIVSQPDFARLLMVSTEDLAGELLVWTENGKGVIGMIQTARRWQRRGVASYLMDDARLYFKSIGVKEMQMDVWKSVPGAIPLANAAGYMGDKPILVYPELEL